MLLISILHPQQRYLFAGKARDTMAMKSRWCDDRMSKFREMIIARQHYGRASHVIKQNNRVDAKILVLYQYLRTYENNEIYQLNRDFLRPCAQVRSPQTFSLPLDTPLTSWDHERYFPATPPFVTLLEAWLTQLERWSSQWVLFWALPPAAASRTAAGGTAHLYVLDAGAIDRYIQGGVYLLMVKLRKEWEIRKA